MPGPAERVAPRSYSRSAATDRIDDLVTFPEMVHYKGALPAHYTMTEFLKMNIFFFVATASLIVFVIMLCGALWYVIKILRSISHVVDTIDEQTQAIATDIDVARKTIKRTGASLLSKFFAVIGVAGKTGKRLLKKQRSS